jgi:hypothetical protein
VVSEAFDPWRWFHLRSNTMALDTKLILDALQYHFDEMDTKMDRWFTAQDARSGQHFIPHGGALLDQATNGLPTATAARMAASASTSPAAAVTTTSNDIIFLSSGGKHATTHHVVAAADEDDITHTMPTRCRASSRCIPASPPLPPPPPPSATSSDSFARGATPGVTTRLSLGTVVRVRTRTAIAAPGYFPYVVLTTVAATKLQSASVSFCLDVAESELYVDDRYVVHGLHGFIPPLFRAPYVEGVRVHPLHQAHNVGLMTQHLMAPPLCSRAASSTTTPSAVSTPPPTPVCTPSATDWAPTTSSMDVPDDTPTKCSMMVLNRDAYLRRRLREQLPGHCLYLQLCRPRQHRPRRRLLQ